MMFGNHLLCIYFAVILATVSADSRLLRRALQTSDTTPDFTDIAYSIHERNVLDLYLTSSPGPNPLIIWTHGGGWARNDKSSIPPGIVQFRDQGYSIASISYRYAPESTYPAPITDAKAAVRFLRANAATYNLDPSRFISIGQSAGGHLASMLGTTIGEPVFEDTTLGNAEVSSAVQLVVSFYGPQDFVNQNVDLAAAGCSTTSGNSIGNVIDCIPPTDCPDLLAEVSPVTHVDGNEPPFMIVQGTADCTVAPGQAQRLHDALNSFGVENEFILVEGGGHTFGSVIQGGNYARMVNFVNGHMGTSEPTPAPTSGTVMTNAPTAGTAEPTPQPTPMPTVMTNAPTTSPTVMTNAPTTSFNNGNSWEVLQDTRCNGWGYRCNGLQNCKNVCVSQEDCFGVQHEIGGGFLAVTCMGNNQILTFPMTQSGTTFYVRPRDQENIQWEIFSPESSMFCRGAEYRIGAPGWNALGFQNSLESCAEACINIDECKFASWRTDSGRGQCNGFTFCDLNPNSHQYRRFIIIKLQSSVEVSL
jgi:acetyl esterase/lipase